MGWLPERRAIDPIVAWETGVTYGTDQPMGLVPFFAAIRHIVDFVSTLPLDSYRIEADRRIPIPTPPLIRRVNLTGGEGQQSWIGKWAFGLAAHGNAVGYVTARDGYGLPLSVNWIGRSDWMCDERTGSWWLFGRPVDPADIVHCPWIVPPGKILGLSPVESFSAFWRAGMSAQAYADVSRGGGLPPTTLRNTMQQIPPADAEKIRDRAALSFASGKPFVTGKDWDLTINPIPPNQAQFLQTLQLTANQTAAIFGIDPREIGGSATESLTYATDESRSLNRANNMRPYLERFESMMTRMLPVQQFVKLNVNATIRTDIKTRTEVIGAQIKDGRLSINDALALEDRPPIPGGDFHNVPNPGRPTVEGSPQ